MNPTGTLKTRFARQYKIIKFSSRQKEFIRLNRFGPIADNYLFQIKVDYVIIHTFWNQWETDIYPTLR